MTEDRARGVLIGYGGDYVRLSFDKLRYDEGLTAAVIEVKTGPFRGEVNDDTIVGAHAFCEQLSDLYERLSGEATLASYDGFELTMSGNGRGAIAVAVTLNGRQVPTCKLIFGFDIDQTFLPEIIKQLRDDIPDKPRGRVLRLVPRA